LVVMLAIVCSPVAWTHYYLLMLLPWAMVLRGLIAQSFDRGVRTLLLASIALSSLPVLDVPDGPALVREILARTLISAWLFGGLALIAALLMLCWRQARRGAERVGSGPSLAEGLLEVGAACAAEQSALPAAPRPGSRP
jgi:glucose-6-phosphate-specific signal transduction histidine kinase